MERLGEATLTTISTPSVTAVWVVAFTVRTFKKIEDMIQLLWQSCSTVSNYSQWTGIVKPKIYSQSRLRELESLYGLLHAKNTLSFLANLLIPVIHNIGNKQGESPFPSSDTLICLISRLFDIENAPQRLEKINQFSVEQICAEMEGAMAFKVSNFFGKILGLSPIENVYWNDDTLFIYLKRNEMFFLPSPMLRRVADYLQQGFWRNISGDIFVDGSQPEEAVLCVLVAGHIKTGNGGPPLITSERWQVTYATFLESLSIDPNSIY